MMSDAVEGCLRRHSSALGNAPDYDTPEPRLAILGPPAVTRRMVDLWRANPRLQARFDLRNPLHRRDYLLWLSEKDRSVGDDTAGSAAVPGGPRFFARHRNGRRRRRKRSGVPEKTSTHG